MYKLIKRLSKLFFVFSILSAICLSVIFFQSCKQDFVNDPGNSAGFPSDIQQIFNTPVSTNSITCTTPSCHASGNNSRNLNLEDWQQTMNGSENGSMVIPYNGFWSHLISVVNTDTNYAPVITITLPEYHKLDAQKVTTIMNWINSGAPNSNGQTAFNDVPINEKGFITNQASDLVAVINQNTHQVLRLIPVGGRPNQLDAPHYITLSPDKKYFYVSLIQEGFIEKYDANTYVKLGRMAADPSPAHIEVTPDGNIGFVTNFESSGSVRTTTKFNTQTMTVIGTFSDPAMTGPHGMAMTRNGQTLFVASEIGEYLFKLSTQSFINDSTFIKSSIDPTVPPSGQGTGRFKPYQIVLSPDEAYLFASCRGSNEVRVYNTSDLSQVNAIQLGTNAYPLLMKITNDGRFLFVCNRNNNTVSVINVATQTLQTTISSVGIQPHGVDFTANGLFAIIACETQSGFDGHHPQVGSTKLGVSRVIRVSDFTLSPTIKIEMGSFPAGITLVK